MSAGDTGSPPDMHSLNGIGPGGANGAIGPAVVAGPHKYLNREGDGHTIGWDSANSPARSGSRHVLTTDSNDGREARMAIRFDRTASDVLLVCTDCPGTWRKGPFPINQEAQANAVAAAHVRDSHTGDKRLSDQLTARARRKAR